MAEESRVEEIAMHQKTISTDENTPLQLIREKELEISGRMLAAKREADAIVADARRKAAELIAAAESEGGASARDHEQSITKTAETESADLRRSASEQAESIIASIETRKADAVELVLKSVTTV